jgi:hypothetical protein
MTTLPCFSHLTAALCALAIASTGAAQTTVNLTSNLDNTLYESPTGALSNGRGNSVYIGLTATGQKRRALLRFDVAGAVPAGSRILSATLSFNVIQSTVALPSPMDLHRVTRAWGEGTSIASGAGGGGTAATPGDATWIHAVNPGSFWTNAGGDFAAAPSFTMPLPDLGPGSSSPAPGATADVQSWLDNPSQNFGWLLKTDELQIQTARRVGSRENVGQKPVLTVTYLAPGQTATWGTGCPVGAGTFGNAWVGAPIGGTTIQIAQTNAPVSSIGANYYSLDLDASGTPLPVAGCTVYLPLAQPLIPGNVFITSASGTASSPFAVPAGFPGFLVNNQAAVITNNALGFVLSNSALALLQ